MVEGDDAQNKDVRQVRTTHQGYAFVTEVESDVRKKGVVT
jgi:hypothetical protein